MMHPRSDPPMTPPGTADAGGGPSGGCRRCGTCCRRGGPALHREDKTLVTDGCLSPAHLYTIRAGELVRDDVASGILTSAESDIVKIRETPGSPACIFFDPRYNSCTIYHQRPLECRILRCWDTAEIRRRYREDRLGRADLIGHIDGLWDLVTAHDHRCDASRLVDLARRLRHGGPDAGAEAELARMIGYDMSLREGMVTDERVPAEILDFLLGRPVKVLLRAMGISIRQRVADGVGEGRVAGR